MYKTWKSGNEISKIWKKQSICFDVTDIFSIEYGLKKYKNIILLINFGKYIPSPYYGNPDDAERPTDYISEQIREEFEASEGVSKDSILTQIFFKEDLWNATKLIRRLKPKAKVWIAVDSKYPYGITRTHIDLKQLPKYWKLITFSDLTEERKILIDYRRFNDLPMAA